jgi:hypothetical protein
MFGNKIQADVCEGIEQASVVQIMPRELQRLGGVGSHTRNLQFQEATERLSAMWSQAIPGDFQPKI